MRYLDRLDYHRGETLVYDPRTQMTARAYLQGGCWWASSGPRRIPARNREEAWRLAERWAALGCCPLPSPRIRRSA